MIELNDPRAASENAAGTAAENTSSAAGENARDTTSFAGWHDDVAVEENGKEQPWKSLKGKFVLAAGVAIPLAMTAAFCALCADRVVRIFMRQCLASTIELVLVLMIPIANYLVWASICNGDRRYAIRRGIMNGVAVGSSFIITAICAAALFSGRVSAVDASLYPLFCDIGLVFLAALASGIFLARQLRRAREVRSAQMRTLLYSLLGFAFAVGGFVAAEARAFCLGLAEQKVVAAPQKERAAAIAQLRALNPEFEMRLECTDTRAAGICGLIYPLKSYTLRQLYFSATGNPFNDNKSEDLSGFSDDYLKRHVVGTPVDGLSLVRSEMSGAVHPDTLSSTVDWTFVFKNTGDNPAEARAEIGLPPGAVIAAMTYWSDGKARDAKFAASANAAGHYNWVSIKATDPALVRDLGRGRALLHCYPVAAQDELKLRLSVVAPLKMQTQTDGILALPRLIDSNFSLEDENTLRLRSALPLELKNIKSNSVADGMRLLVSSLQESDLKGAGVTVKVHRAPSMAVMEAGNPVSGRSPLIAESIQAVPTTTPSQVVVVLDGSSGMKKYIDEIKSALAATPASIPAYLVVGRDDGNIGEPVPLKDGLKALKANQFTGGQDNLQAICKAAEAAGETKHGAVVWIHGPQSGLNKEIYILPQNVAPSFYELALDGGSADSAEFFKNHPEIGPFSPVPRNETSIAGDLISFFNHMQPGSVDYRATLAETAARAGNLVESTQQAHELAALYALQQCNSSMRLQNSARACLIAVAYGIVTPVSSAVVLPSGLSAVSLVNNAVGQAQQSSAEEASSAQTQSVAGAALTAPSPEPTWQSFNNATISPQTAAPMLQGATNGSLGPQGADVTYVTGLNTAGAVRVNNLANLEALLNVIASSIEVIGLVWGSVIAVQGLMHLLSGQAQPTGKKQWFGPGAKMATGIAVVLIGFWTPGMINWLVASARDANLFN